MGGVGLEVVRIQGISGWRTRGGRVKGVGV